MEVSEAAEEAPEERLLIVVDSPCGCESAELEVSRRERLRSCRRRVEEMVGCTEHAAHQLSMGGIVLEVPLTPVESAPLPLRLLTCRSLQPCQLTGACTPRRTALSRRQPPSFPHTAAPPRRPSNLTLTLSLVRGRDRGRGQACPRAHRAQEWDASGCVPGWDLQATPAIFLLLSSHY
jgi:hypothetical protein